VAIDLHYATMDDDPTTSKDPDILKSGVGFTNNAGFGKFQINDATSANVDLQGKRFVAVKLPFGADNAIQQAYVRVGDVDDDATSSYWPISSGETLVLEARGKTHLHALQYIAA